MNSYLINIDFITNYKMKQYTEQNDGVIIWYIVQMKLFKFIGELVLTRNI